jgi:hypothetical protein
MLQVGGTISNNQQLEDGALNRGEVGAGGGLKIYPVSYIYGRTVGLVLAGFALLINPLVDSRVMHQSQRDKAPVIITG